MPKILKGLKLFLLLFFVVITLCGCGDKESGILFNREPIKKENVLNATRTLDVGKRIYFLFYTSKKINAEFIRVQVFSTGDNIPKGGYNILWTKDCRIMKQNMYYYYDYFVIHKSGRYVMQIFDVNNLVEPLAWNYFYVE